MSKIINITDIKTCDFMQEREGEFRTVVKVQAGFLVIVDHRTQWKTAMDVFRSYRGGALQSIEFKAEGTNTWLTIFAKSGNKVKLMDVEMMKDMKVGDINDGKYWSKTNLYNFKQYQAVNSKTWASSVFVMNEAA